MKKIIIVFIFILVLVSSSFFIKIETFTIKDIEYGQDEYPIMLTVKSNKTLNPTENLVNVLVDSETMIFDTDNTLIELTDLEIGKKIKIQFKEQLIKVLPGIPLKSAETIEQIN
ncbi:hypothetical protein [Bacillus alkalicellulosilyticus]|uniref:hypothetical protein n=1 Tax=Alkalihalobacterium alkalicellulosilyticum TaxID=1912214 RepID=UPI000998567A|nr:hypothetical protein [Bacillus alkalicellulosilyticus]